MSKKDDEIERLRKENVELRAQNMRLVEELIASRRATAPFVFVPNALANAAAAPAGTYRIVYPNTPIPYDGHTITCGPTATGTIRLQTTLAGVGELDGSGGHS